MNNLLYRSAVVMMLLTAMFAVFASPVLADAPAPDEQMAKYEIKFMEDMIDHHAMAVMMAEMCLMKAVHPDLIAMCQDIIATQMQEIEVMQMWLMDWYGISHEPDMHMGGMEHYMMMDSEEFEIHFMKRMIGHHATAIKEAEDCLEEAYHGELIETCQNIIVTQFQEIETMQTWLCEWYGVCNYRQGL